MRAMTLIPPSGVRADFCRVLVVDDDPDTAEMMEFWLQKHGHETHVCHGSLTALEVAAMFRPQIAFLDIGLPGMDGFQLASKLRAMPELASCQLIAVSGYAPLGSTVPFDDYLVKPVSAEAIISLVTERGSRNATQTG